MKQRDILWITTIWIVLLLLAAAVATFFTDDDPATNDAVGAGLLAVILGVLATGLYVYGRRRSWDRRDALSLAGIWVLVLGAALAVGAAPAFGGVIGYVLSACYLAWSRKHRRARQRMEAPPIRTCPQCGTHMHHEARICSRCGSDSAPWTFYDGSWWTRDEAGKWQSPDTESGVSGSYPDGDPTPSLIETGESDA